MVSGTTLTIKPSFVVSLSTTTANDDGSGDYSCISAVFIISSFREYHLIVSTDSAYTDSESSVFLVFLVR